MTAAIPARKAANPWLLELRATPKPLVGLAVEVLGAAVVVAVPLEVVVVEPVAVLVTDEVTVPVPAN